MSDTEAKIKITADTTALQPGLDAAGNAIAASVRKMSLGFDGLKAKGAASFTGIAQEASNSANMMVTSNARATRALMGLWNSLGMAIGGNFRHITQVVRSLHRVQALLTKKEAMNQAYGAATAAYKSVASIPYVGAFLAPAAAAAAFATTSGFASAIASAEGGYDIPAGVNPMTQLHAREMVLPAKYADIIRGLGGERQGVATDAAPVIHIHAVDAHSVRRLFSDHGSELVSALKAQHRNFAVAS